MAKYRQIHVKIWKDDWFMELEPEEKLLFVYLFSNERASVSGLYELPLKVMAFETGMNKNAIDTILSKFARDGKVYYESGVVWVVNLRKYHETASVRLQKGIENDLDDVKDCVLKRAYMQAMGMVTADDDEEGDDLPESDTPQDCENTVSQDAEMVSIPSNSLVYITSPLIPDLENKIVTNGQNGHTPKRPLVTSKKPTSETTLLLEAYQEALGYEIPNYGQEGAAAKKLAGKHDIGDVIGCYCWLKSQEFWRQKHLPLASVNKQIGAWQKAGRPSGGGISSGNSEGVVRI